LWVRPDSRGAHRSKSKNLRNKTLPCAGRGIVKAASGLLILPLYAGTKRIVIADCQMMFSAGPRGKAAVRANLPVKLVVEGVTKGLFQIGGGNEALGDCIRLDGLV